MEKWQARKGGIVTDRCPNYSKALLVELTKVQGSLAAKVLNRVLFMGRLKELLV